ncbi:Uncharacterised protein [Bordetella hinzii]|uniref:AAA family ATPase n=1 Tax=Bordetella hinzii TaxID=103855 RepID=UPI000459509A|nr:AAA family ATPase [Bordetella hinzii]AKQ56401.1 hypothetical protein ACR54_03099 [Bordetella hinzii]KCB28560.1 hypothetical protein L543_3491 [Bordetella hinzii L60]SNV74826.1 Uncharacterised protein [Bordetella hinzii]
MSDSMTLLEQAQARIDATLPPQEPLPPIDAYFQIPHGEGKRSNVKLTQATDVIEKSVEWLWPGWLARGKLTILAGDAGCGKTTLALGLAATVTAGGYWPDGAPHRDVGNVLIWSGEDDAADTLKPRLAACGAECSRVFFIDGLIDTQGKTQPFDPATDTPGLIDAVAQIGGASLLIVDPIVSAVAGDMHRSNDVRRALQPLVDLAEAQGCAVIGISHLRKGSDGTKPQDRVIGSQAFGALARTVLMAAKKEEENIRVLARAKNNLALDDGGVSYTVESYILDSGIETTRVLWGGRIEGSAREILGTVEHQPEGGASDLADAVQFLRDLLSDGPVPVKAIRADATDAGYSWATIRRAQKEINAQAIKEGQPGSGSKQRWIWRLP